MMELLTSTFKIMVMIMIATEDIMQSHGSTFEAQYSEMCKCPGYARTSSNSKPPEPMKLNGEVNADWIRIVNQTTIEQTKDESGHTTYEYSAVFVFQDNDGSGAKWKFHTYEVFMQALNRNGLPLGKWSWFHDEATQGIYNKTSEFNETCNKKHALDGESTRPIDYTDYFKENSSYASISCPRFREIFTDDDFEQTDVSNMFHYSSITTEPRVKFCAVWKLKVTNSQYFKPSYLYKEGWDKNYIYFIFEMNWGRHSISTKDNYNEVYNKIERKKQSNMVYYNKMTYELTDVGKLESIPENVHFAYLNSNYSSLVYKKDGNGECIAPHGIPIAPSYEYKSYSYLLFHPNIRRKSLDTDASGQLANASNPVKYKECFSLEAYPLPPKDKIEEVHVSFRHHPDPSKPVRCRFLRATEITLQVYNTPHNFPIGRGQPKGSWRLSDDTTEKENRCANETTNLSHLEHDVHYKFLTAVSDPTIEHSYDRFNNSFWKQNRDDVYPTMLWARFRNGKEIGLCATWSFITPDLYYTTNANSFLFVAEIMVYDPPGTKTPTILVLSDELFYKPNSTAIIQTEGECHNYRSSGKVFRNSSVPAHISHIHSAYYRACVHKDNRAELDTSTNERIDGCSVPKFKGYTPTNAPYKNNVTFKGRPIRYNGTTTDIAKQQRNDFYSGCSDTKACVTSCKKKNCIKSRTCELVIAYGGQEDTSLYKKSNEIVVEIYGRALKWVAMGISKDKSMGSDYVVECCSESGKISLYNSWNVKAEGNKAKNNIRQTKDQGTEGVVRLVKGFYKDSNIYCKFYIKESFSRTPKHQNQTYHFNLLKDSYYILIASGSELVVEGIGGNVKRHVPDSAVVSCEKVNLGIRFSPTLSQLTSLKVHEYILTFAWFIFLPIGMFVGRYMKETNRNYVIFNIEVWKFVHIACMCIGYFLIFVSLICHIYGRFGWQRTYESGFHTTMGWIIEFSVVLIMITGYILAKDIGDEGFDWVQFSHAFFGHFVYIGGLFMFYFSPSRLKFSDMPCSLSYWVIAWLIIYLLLQVPISLHYCWLDYLYCNGWGQISSSVFVFKTLTLKNATDADAPGGMVRIIMTLIFTIFTIIIGVSIITTVFSSSPCHPIAIVA